MSRSSSSRVNMPVGFATYLALKDTVHYVEYGEHHIPCTSKPAYSGCFFNLHMCDDVIGIAHLSIQGMAECNLETTPTSPLVYFISF